MAEYEASLVECPYYIENTTMSQIRRNLIRCEGVSADCTINLEFKTKQEQTEYMENHCFSLIQCKSCRVCKMLDEKYGVRNYE